jgi:ribosomal protein L11 methyltransferase
VQLRPKDENMQWIELSIDTTHEAVDWVRTLLAATNYTGDVRVTKYTDPDLHDLTDRDVVEPHWAFTICLYLLYDAHARGYVEEIVNQLSPLHRTGLTTAVQTAVVEEKRKDAGMLSPLVHRIGQRFVVLAPDAPYKTEVTDEIPLKLNTTLAFGSGLHPATIASLQLLDRYIVPSMNVLDLGSGSGILSVAMAKLGARVLALDNDSMAVKSTQDAVRLNGVEQQVTVTQGSLGGGSELGHWMGGDIIDNMPTIEATQTFDLIVTNILARVHIALADDYRQALRRTDARTGVLITAGFTAEREEEVDTALVEAGFEAIDCERLNEWVALAHQLKV